MSTLTIPTRLESHLALEDGSSGAKVSEVIGLAASQVPNLYTCSQGQFIFSFQERGVAYGDNTASEQKAEVTVSLSSDISPTFTLLVQTKPVEKWGVNFTGSVLVHHNTGEERMVYLPGTRTYDPAGITGDPHASERIGPSCSRTQLAITLSQLVAVSRGATEADMNTLQETTLPLIQRYHGRELLFEWMSQQICEAVYKKEEVTPYPVFLQQRLDQGKIEVGSGREHTALFLQSYATGQPKPPLHYYRKVAAKDNPTELLSAEELKIFNTIISSLV